MGHELTGRGCVFPTHMVRLKKEDDENISQQNGIRLIGYHANIKQGMGMGNEATNMGDHPTFTLSFDQDMFGFYLR